MINKLSFKRSIFLLILSSIIGRIVTFILLPNNPSNFAPDEGTYANLAEWVSSGKSVKNYPSYGENLYESSRALILPAVMFNKIGLNSLDSVRLVSTIYGVLSLCVIALFFSIVMTRNSLLFKSLTMKKTQIVIVFAIFSFLPSHFLWSVLGLRESATEFYVICAFLIFYFIFYISTKNRATIYLLLYATIQLSFYSRPQVAICLCASLMLFCLVNYRKRESRRLLIVLGISCVLNLSYLSTGTSSSTSSSSSSSSSSSTSSTSSSTSNSSVKIVLNTFLDKHKFNQVNANSIITRPNCKSYRDSESNVKKYLAYPFCIAAIPAYTSATFLFRPALGVDYFPGIGLIAIGENILWFALVVFIIALIIRNRKISHIKVIYPALYFFLIYVILAGLYEGNMGTAFRHKSLCLPFLLFFTAVIMAPKNRNKLID